MKILLIANGYDYFIRKELNKVHDVINSEPIYYSKDNAIYEGCNCDLILLIDMEYSSTLALKKEAIDALLNIRSTLDIPFFLITSDSHLIEYIESHSILNEIIQLHKYLGHAVDSEYVINCLSKVHFKHRFSRDKKSIATPNNELDNRKIQEGNSRKSFFNRFKTKQKDIHEQTDSYSKEIGKISRGISRVIGITGHRGSGITSTTVNLAVVAQKMGLSSIIIDLDVDYRSMNMYFSGFNEITTTDEVMNASLVRMLAKPQEYMTNSYHIKDDLWLSSLGYGFEDKQLLERFFTANYIIGMISLLRTKFNIVWLDLPMDILSKFPELLSHVDGFGLCVHNNLYSIVTTLRNIEISMKSEHGRYLNSKTKIICTKHNAYSKFENDYLTGERVASIMASGISDVFIYEPKVAGELTYDENYDEQIERDIPIVNQKSNFEKMFSAVLLRLIEGA